ncbi:ATP-binding protein [Alkalihalobacillus sp. TS-13]|uniref:ATP-binding protein n=1 Tax=Alkalihalobacillus sp. TS-13 TaxID=2842455 RepID=UPI001C8839B2|nr:ATP-binding protein [Alkalihalobacillus sp. TS-13]
MRNAIIIPIDKDEKLIIASDNSGAIGEKEMDAVKVGYDIVSYYSFRVAVMECMAAGGTPISVLLHNFCGDDEWGKLVKGVKKGLSDLGMEHVSISGSTESNFPLEQSAVGIVVIGKGKPPAQDIIHGGFEAAVIGSPLIGHEVIEQNQKVASLSIFNKILDLDDVYVWPVGSKGILHELKQINSQWSAQTSKHIDSDVDLNKPAGPSTCFIALYPSELSYSIKELTGSLYHPLNLMT